MGVGYRYSEDTIYPTATFETVPTSDSQDLFSIFIQDEYRVNDAFRVTLGTKIEHNDYTDFEIQPTLRASWLASDTQTLWAAVSRAVRTPNRAENDMRLFIRPLPQVFNLPIPGVIFGNEYFESVEVIAYELGYRNTIRSNLMFDIALFYNQYTNERNFDNDPSNTEPFPPGVIPLIVNNDNDFDTNGVEFTIDYRPVDRWTIRTGYSYMNTNLDGGDTSNTPQQQASLTNQIQVTDEIQFDTTFRYTDQLPGLEDIDDYFTLDARLAWRPSDSLEMSLNGRNLFDDDQSEFIEFVANRLPTGVERSVYGQIT
ncbi:MAG: TonB-dependent receptor [Candidatus Hydrogenedentota bacterium]